MIYGKNQVGYQKTLVKRLCIIYWKNKAMWEVRTGGDAHRRGHPMRGCSHHLPTSWSSTETTESLVSLFVPLKDFVYV